MNNQKLSDEEIEQELKRIERTEVNDSTISYAIEKEEYINKISKKGPLLDKFADLKLLFEMLKNNGKENNKGEKFSISPAALAIVVGSLLYVISPIDIIPDAIPVIGFIDDAAIITAAITQIKKIGDDIKNYKKWKEESNID